MSLSTSFKSEVRATLALAIPIMAGQVSQMLMGILDSAMVGHIGVVPLAASAFANNLAAVPIVFGIGLLTCLSVRVAQAEGAGQRQEIGEILRHGLALAVMIGLSLMLVMFGLSFELHHFNQPTEVVQEARPFFLLLAISFVPALLGLGLKQFSEALHNPWPPTLFLLAAVPVNAALNWVFIYGNLGFPAMGLTGAGLATLLARILSLVVIAIYVWRSLLFQVVLPKRWMAPLKGNTLREMAAIGLPSGLQIGLEVTAFSVGALLVGMLGATALAAHQIALSCAATTFMLPLGIGMATTIRIGGAHGANEWERVRAIGWSSVAISTAVMGVAALVFFLFGHSIAAGFVKDAQVIDLAARLLFVAAIFQMFDGVQVTTVGALRGLSDAVWPMCFSLIGYWILGLPIGYLLAFHHNLGAVGIWIGLAIGLGAVANLLSIRFFFHTHPTRVIRQKSVKTAN